jgi:hypothetical protein
MWHIICLIYRFKIPTMNYTVAILGFFFCLLRKPQNFDFSACFCVRNDPHCSWRQKVYHNGPHLLLRWLPGLCAPDSKEGLFRRRWLKGWSMELIYEKWAWKYEVTDLIRCSLSVVDTNYSYLTESSIFSWDNIDQLFYLSQSKLVQSKLINLIWSHHISSHLTYAYTVVYSIWCNLLVKIYSKPKFNSKSDPLQSIYSMLGCA